VISNIDSAVLLSIHDKFTTCPSSALAAVRPLGATEGEGFWLPVGGVVSPGFVVVPFEPELFSAAPVSGDVPVLVFDVFASVVCVRLTKRSQPLEVVVVVVVAGLRTQIPLRAGCVVAVSWACAIAAIGP
jgi:hypothetical protein